MSSHLRYILFALGYILFTLEPLNSKADVDMQEPKAVGDPK